MPRATDRVPQNLPFLIDNLWEWSRPAGYPSRRRSVFASPDASGAQASASASLGAERVLYRLDLPKWFHVAQVFKGGDPSDARYHRDTRTLNRFVLDSLGPDWLQLPPDQRGREGMLFQPLLSASDVESILSASTRLDGEAIRDQIEFWRDVAIVEHDCLIHECGEVFFECPESGVELCPMDEPGQADS